MHQTSQPPLRLIGVPVEAGAGQTGCASGPMALLDAGLPRALTASGHRVDIVSLRPGPVRPISHPNPAITGLGEVAAWTATLAEAAYAASEAARPVFLGGDHSLSAGTLSGIARRAVHQGRPLFVLWLDAHPDFHTLDTTASGNLHGVPLAYATGRPGFEGCLPTLAATVDPSRLCLLGTRSIDDAEAAALAQAGVATHPPRRGGANLSGALARFLDQVRAADGMLHVSLDVDFLDPVAAPGVGTPVPGGVAVAEAFRLMDMLARCRLMTSLDVVELNPAHDRQGRTARLMVDLAARLIGPAVAKDATAAIAA